MPAQILLYRFVKHIRIHHPSHRDVQQIIQALNECETHRIFPKLRVALPGQLLHIIRIFYDILKHSRKIVFIFPARIAPDPVKNMIQLLRQDPHPFALT